MLRRPPTVLSVTSEDVSAYEDRRTREAQQAAAEIRQFERQQRHAAMAARAEAPGLGRRRTQERLERVMGDQAAPLPAAGPADASRIADPFTTAPNTAIVGRGMQGRLAQARARQQQAQYTTLEALDVDDSALPEDMDVESDSGPEDSMLEARRQMQARRAAAAVAAARGERQATPPTLPRQTRRTRDERIHGDQPSQAPQRRR